MINKNISTRSDDLLNHFIRMEEVLVEKMRLVMQGMHVFHKSLQDRLPQ
jgi:hypothetical protein